MTLYEKLTELVVEQAEDDSLWLPAKTPPEVKLQDALRRLHTAVGFIDEKVNAAIQIR